MQANAEDEDEHICRLEKRLRDLELQVLESSAELQKARGRRAATVVEEEKKKSDVKLGKAVKITGDNSNNAGDRDDATDEEEQDDTLIWNWPMKREEYKRYGRQLIMPEIGIKGQLRLKRSRVLIVGVGGLGCPALAYLAGAGVGTIGLVDGDVVEESNLARQILHTTAGVSRSKVVSAIEFARALNPNVQYRAHVEDLLPERAADIVQQYDIVLDCTDHPTSRYLVSDVCVLHGIPLVSASALRIDGQLLALNNPPRKPGDSNGGPCYRCIFPKPPPPESLVTCGDGGILGPAVGVMGVLQALETIKIVIAGKFVSHETVNRELFNEEGIYFREGAEKSVTRKRGEAKSHHMLLFTAMPDISFRTVRIRGRRPNCSVCSSDSTITLESIKNGSLDYERFCGITKPIVGIDPSERITVQQLAALREKEMAGLRLKQDIDNSRKAVQVWSKDTQDTHQKETNSYTKAKCSTSYALIDIRNDAQFDIVHLTGSINIPFTTIEADGCSSQATPLQEDSSAATTPQWAAPLVELPKSTPIHVICRRGNDSQVAVRRLKQLGFDGNGERYVGDVIGGISEWIKHHGEHEGGFPDY